MDEPVKQPWQLQLSHGSDPLWRNMRVYARALTSSLQLNSPPRWLLIDVKAGIPTSWECSFIGIWICDDGWLYCFVMLKLMRKVVSFDSTMPMRIFCGLMSWWMKLWEWIYLRWDTYNGCQVQVYSGRGSSQVWMKADERERSEFWAEVSPGWSCNQLDSTTRTMSIGSLCRFWSDGDGDGQRNRSSDLDDFRLKYTG